MFVLEENRLGDPLGKHRGCNTTVSARFNTDLSSQVTVWVGSGLHFEKKKKTFWCIVLNKCKKKINIFKKLKCLLVFLTCKCSKEGKLCHLQTCKFLIFGVQKKLCAHLSSVTGASEDVSDINKRNSLYNFLLYSIYCMTFWSVQ